MSIFAPALGALWKQLEGYGIDPEPVFRESGIAPDILFDPGARVPLDRFQDLNVRALDLSGDPFFGLKSARYARPVHLGALGFAWLASGTLRSAFERLSRYSHVIQDKLLVELDGFEGIVVGDGRGRTDHGSDESGAYGGRDGFVHERIL